MKRLDWNNFPWHSAVFMLSTLAMIGLGVAGFIVPPLGMIDPSVFQYGSLLCVPLVVSQVKPVLLEARQLRHLKVSTGKVSLETHNSESDPPPNDGE